MTPSTTPSPTRKPRIALFPQGRREWLKAFARLGGLATIPLIAVAWMTVMPGRSHTGALPPMTDEESALAARLRADVEAIGGTIGERNHLRTRELEDAAKWIESSLAAGGLRVASLPFTADTLGYRNLEVEVPGTTRDVLVVGAHYDSAHYAPGANDNGSGVAATIELAKSLGKRRFHRTLRFVLFANEEPPFFQNEGMGSLVYARACKARGDSIVGMISLETMGYFRDEPGTQHYPPPLGAIYPSRGDFIAFVGNTASRALVRDVVRSFRATTAFPSEGAALPGAIPGIGWSDHWSFWQQDVPAIEVTDTAPFRYPHYHKVTDTPDKLDYARMARVVAGLGRVIEELGGAP